MNIYIQMVYINSTQRKNGLDPGMGHPPPRAVDIRRKRSQILRLAVHNRIAHNSRGPPSTLLRASSFFLALSTHYVLNCILLNYFLFYYKDILNVLRDDS